MIMGEQERIVEFWNHYGDEGQEMRLAGRELLFELKPPVRVHEEIRELRQATAADLELIIPVQAQMAFEESEVNPLDVDPEGFRRRCLRRIEQGRTWVLVENEKLLFKAEIISDTPDVSYLEGIHVAADERGKYSVSLSQLTDVVPTRTRSVYSGQQAKYRCTHLYRRGRFKFHSVYDTISREEH